MQKIIRTICVFSDHPASGDIVKLKRLESKLQESGFIVQTIRLCTNNTDFLQVRDQIDDHEIRLSIGSIDLPRAYELLEAFHTSHNINFNLELSQSEITQRHVDLLFDIIRGNTANTFNFTYLFNGLATPYFPSATYSENGFAVGLQPTNLSVGYESLEAWLDEMQRVWDEIVRIMEDERDFLGIDSSIAPLFQGNGSLVNFVKRLGFQFPKSTTTDIFTTISSWIKTRNPKPYGLNGLMFPCLEDFELADEYEKGEFSVERNIYLSLHSGLGIDTYPIGTDESPGRILEILKLMKALSNKYSKPLSTRFVSDGIARIGEKTDFKNPYLKDVVVRKL